MQLIVQGFVSGKRIWIIEDNDNLLVKFQEVQQSWETSVEAPVPVHLQPVLVHPCRKVAESNLYRYKRVRVEGIEQEFDSNARARSSFNNQCGITMEKGIKAKGWRKKAAF